MQLTILGVDPGEQTGVGIVRVGAQAPFRVEIATSMFARDFPNWVRNLLQTNAIDGFAIEDWTFYRGPRGKAGAAQAAFAVGRVVGALEGVGVQRWVELKRPTILSALGLKASADKAACEGAVRMLTDLKGNHNDHVWDAVAVAIAGAGRFNAVMAVGS